MGQVNDDEKTFPEQDSVFAHFTRVDTITNTKRYLLCQKGDTLSLYTTKRLTKLILQYLITNTNIIIICRI